MLNNENKDGEASMPKRREFLLKTFKGLGLATVGGIVWGGLVEDGRSAPLILRPPAAQPEKEFVATCIKCGMCVEACPYDSLELARPGEKKPIGTPYYIPRRTPCYMCKDIPCVPVCPTGSLDKSLVSERDENGVIKLNINMAKMGLAIIDRETCIAYSGIQCDACYRACPLIDRAITVEYSRNQRTGKHAILTPVVHNESCTGCGLCEKACVTEKASIFVLPRKIAMGKEGSHYIKGWDERDEDRLKDITGEISTETPRSDREPIDYLNQEDF
jgi:ferredoxin-type protein NapG